MERDEWKSGMMVEDEQILDFISEIDEAIDKAKKTFKDYRPLLNGDRWISDREAAEFLKVSRHTLFIYRQKGRRTRFFPWHPLPEYTSTDGMSCTQIFLLGGMRAIHGLSPPCAEI